MSLDRSFQSEDYFEAGGEVDEIKIGLCLYGDELDPDNVTELLGVEPTFTARKGDERRA